MLCSGKASSRAGGSHALNQSRDLIKWDTLLGQRLDQEYLLLCVGI